MSLLNSVADFIWNREKSPFPETVSRYISVQSGLDPQAASTVVFYVCRLNRTHSLNIALVHAVEKLLASFIPSDSEIDRMIADSVRASESLENTVAAAGKLSSANKGLLISFAEDLLVIDCTLSMLGTVDSESFFKLFCAMGLSNHRATEVIADETARRAKQKKGRMISSGAGLFVAFAVIIVFILAATFLKAVVFGFIFAYFFLPLEKYFEKLFSSNPLFVFADKAVHMILNPFSRIKDDISKKAGFPADTRDQTSKDAASLTRKATFTTCISVFLGIIIAVSLITYFAFSASTSIGNSIISAVKDTELIQKAEDVASRLVKQDVVTAKAIVSPPPGDVHNDEAPYVVKPIPEPHDQHTLSNMFFSIRKAVNDYVNKNFSHVASFALAKSGSIISGLYAVISALGTMLFDLLICVFFFIFFLEKMALYTLKNKPGSPDALGQMIVNSIFNSGWLPTTSNASKREASSIISRISLIFKKWVRGYLSVIMIESILYTVLFLIFRVPYAPVFGVIAGSTILLPIVGPIASFLLTAGFCIAFVDSYLIVTLIGVSISYLVLHGVVEQLILYPYFVGESIGLTTLETIIVVLLGAMIAGVTGMIFAVPAAAVLKYLIPEVYRLLMPNAQANTK